MIEESLSRLLALGFDKLAIHDALIEQPNAQFEVLVSGLLAKQGLDSLNTEQARMARSLKLSNEGTSSSGTSSTSRSQTRETSPTVPRKYILTEAENQELDRLLAESNTELFSSAEELSFVFDSNTGLSRFMKAALTTSPSCASPSAPNVTGPIHATARTDSSSPTVCNSSPTTGRIRRTIPQVTATRASPKLPHKVAINSTTQQQPAKSPIPPPTDVVSACALMWPEQFGHKSTQPQTNTSTPAEQIQEKQHPAIASASSEEDCLVELLPRQAGPPGVGKADHQQRTFELPQRAASYRVLRERATDDQLPKTQSFCVVNDSSAHVHSKPSALKSFLGLRHERAGSVVIHPDNPLYGAHEACTQSLSAQVVAKAKRAKAAIERHITTLQSARFDRERRKFELEQEMTLMNISDRKKSLLRTALRQRESDYLRSRRTTVDLLNFSVIKLIGRGAFGEVSLVRHQESRAVFAMKVIRKADILQANHVARVKAEREIMASADSDWIVRLYYSFHDQRNLYFVMQYVPGGDLMSLLINKGRFSEEMTRFYIAELVMVVESLHQMGFIHRDIKPDNILIDADGHIKLSDFGLSTDLEIVGRMTPAVAAKTCSCTAACRCAPASSTHRASQHSSSSRSSDRRKLARSLVGTPNYMAPEIFQRVVYGKECDWWSVGCLMFEMFMGYPPFAASCASETRHRVIHWYQHLTIPSHHRMSSSARDLILRLCCDAPRRIGTAGGADEIKRHAFFRSTTWSRSQPAPYKPTITHDTDTSNFVLDGRVPQHKNKHVVPSLDLEDEFSDFNWQRFWDAPHY